MTVLKSSVNPELTVRVEKWHSHWQLGFNDVVPTTVQSQYFRHLGVIAPPNWHGNGAKIRVTMQSEFLWGNVREFMVKE